MNYAKIDKNDITNGEGVCVSLWVSGCSEPHCPGCHNSSLWGFDSGTPFTEDALNEIFTALSANGVQRNFSVLGGEPLAPQNIPTVASVVKKVHEHYPNIKIYLWSGYTFDYLRKQIFPNDYGLALQTIFQNINYLIDGPYIAAERDITLKLRGSRNQHIWKKEDGQWAVEE